MKITREIAYGPGTGTITPNKGDNDWYKIGDVVTFTATGSDGTATTVFTFNSWVVDGAFGQDDEYSESGNLLVVKVARPATIRASFGQDNKFKIGSFNLTVTNYGIKEGDPVPETLVGGVELPYDTVTNLSRVSTDVLLATNTYTDVDGEDRTCLGWQLMDGDGNLHCAIYDLGYIVVVPTNFVKGADGANTVIRQSNGGGLVINGNDVINPMTKKVIAEEDGFRLYELGDTTPLSWIGVNPNTYGITNGAPVTLQWLWEIPMEPEEGTTFDIEWNETLDNLHVGYETNLLSQAEMEELGVGLDDLEVTAPVGWIATTSLDADGNAIATLARDDEALSDAMDTCTLTIFSNDDDSDAYTVQADITAALRGFWYVLYGSDDLATWEAVASGTYESGTPSAQAQGTPDDPYDAVTLSIIVTPGDTAAGVKRFYKVMSGATKDPLAETSP